MNQQELIRAVARKTALSQPVTEQLLRATTGIIAQGLHEGKAVKLQHFGSFEVRQHTERTITNPRNGDKTVIPAKEVWTFKPNDRLKQTVNTK